MTCHTIARANKPPSLMRFPSGGSAFNYSGTDNFAELPGAKLDVTLKLARGMLAREGLRAV